MYLVRVEKLISDDIDFKVEQITMNLSYCKTKKIALKKLRVFMDIYHETYYLHSIEKLADE
jgi:hypothetical protein